MILDRANRRRHPAAGGPGRRARGVSARLGFLVAASCVGGCYGSSAATDGAGDVFDGDADAVDVREELADDGLAELSEAPDGLADDGAADRPGDADDVTEVGAEETGDVVPPIVAITIEPVTATLHAGSGEMVELTATGHFSDGTSRDVTESATWASSDETVATVSNAPGSRGVVTSGPIESGVVQIRASTEGITSAPAIISVLGCLCVVDVVVDPPTAVVPAGMSRDFTATATYGDGRSSDVTASATWDSSNPAVATIDRAGWATGVSAGTTAISALYGGLPGSAELTVTEPVLVSIVVEPSTATVPTGFTQAFVAFGTFSDGSSAALTSDPDVTWSSGNPAVATVSNAAGSKGVATAVSSGAATIEARYVSGSVDVSGTATLVATSCDPFGPLDVRPETATVAVGSTTALTAISGTTCGTEVEVTWGSTWTSFDPTIATVSGGLVTGVSPGGPVTITADWWMITDTASVTVVP
ncbi:MAG: Ig-like domain-containing protein [Deltaproteobacteria bacterium]|nr:Ig-like domain-containing protein [Deltaproteobacteria bacterium]